MKNMVVLVAGGTGFVGKKVVHLLQKNGHRVVIYSRKQRVVPTHADVIVNLVGIIREDYETYKEAHIDLTKWLIGLGRKLHVRQFVQMSALGVEAQETQYQLTKLHAEKFVKASGLPYVIIRPSMIFGSGDQSINHIRAVSRTGFFPVLANGTQRPVSIDTVAQVILAAAEKRIRNRTVEVAGPEIFTIRQLAERIHPGVHTFRIPNFVVGLLCVFGTIFISLPTREQVIMLGQSHTTKDKTLERLGIKNPRL